MTDLRNLEELKRACVDTIKTAETSPGYKEWGQQLLDFLGYVRDADEETRASTEFQRRIWDENPVASVGQGTISVEAAIQDGEFRKWLAGKSLRQLPQDIEARGAALDQLFGEIQDKVGKYTNKSPKLKIYRVLASFFPSDFTTISDIKRLLDLHMALFGNRKGAGPSWHLHILWRLREALGEPGEDIEAIVDRMRLPWRLFEDYVAPSEEEPTKPTSETPDNESLVPLPAARRRRGLTGVSGGFQAALNILEFCRGGANRDDLKSQIGTISPSLKDSSIATQINIFTSEFNCLKRDVDQYTLTDRGNALLESGDPAELMDWLITRILGIYHVSVILRDEGPCTMVEMVPRIQQVNPGWTSNWMPNLMVNELRDFGMLDRDENRILSLTDTGREWANRIDWNPEVLVKRNGPTTPPGVGKRRRIKGKMPRSDYQYFPRYSGRFHRMVTFLNPSFAVLTLAYGRTSVVTSPSSRVSPARARRYSLEPMAEQLPESQVATTASSARFRFNRGGTIQRHCWDMSTHSRVNHIYAPLFSNSY